MPCGAAAARPGRGASASCAARASAKSSAQDSTSGRRRSSARRSRSVIPPQTPNSIRWSSACARHSVRTGQTRQKCRASRCLRPVTKRSSASDVRQRDALRQFHRVSMTRSWSVDEKCSRSAQTKSSATRFTRRRGNCATRPRARTLRCRDVSPPTRATDRPVARFVPGRGRADRRDRVPRRRGARARVQRRGRHGHHGLHRRRRRPAAAHHHRHRRRGRSDRPVLRAQPEPAGRHVRSRSRPR